MDNEESRRLEAQREGREDWRLWGPYLAERAWGTVREDYSADGNAWAYFPHDHARSRAYRWNEDGLGGLSDVEQRLCFSVALWNGIDPILKERPFGLTGPEGNHGEDVKECYFYRDATPSHAWLRFLYKYPQAPFPYRQLVQESARRTRHDPTFSLLDTGVFADDRYWDVEVCYAKSAPDAVHIRITATNRGPEAATLHVLPTLWFRNTWSWTDDAMRPWISGTREADGWALQARHATLGAYVLRGADAATLLFTENDTNHARLFGSPNASPYVKDAFHRHVVDGERGAVNPAGIGTKAAAHSLIVAAPGESVRLRLMLAAAGHDPAMLRDDGVFARRELEADAFYETLLPDATAEDHSILRQALAGMIFSQQFYHYEVARWIDGDGSMPPPERRRGRNHAWRHLRAHHVISMPDKWEYPWFAAWDLAYHCAALALVDIEFAKAQVELLLKEDYLHPNGQLPAYEWSFEDANPPVIAMAALKVFRADRVQRGVSDVRFLQCVMNKLLLDYGWWLNRKDAEGHGVFEGGFLGLDNISVHDRSMPLSPGFRLRQADATGWMAMLALNMTVIALELAAADSDYEDIAIQCYEQFLAIANALAGHGSGGDGLSLWDPADGFFKDVVVGPEGRCQRVDVFSWVGIIPLFACEIIDRRLLANAPRFARILDEHGGGVFDGRVICACPQHVNARGEHLLALVDATMLPRMLRHILAEDEFLSPHGVRSVSRVHAERRELGDIPGIGRAMMEYVPGESNSSLFGGNSNWRGPIWMPTNYTLVQTLEKYYRYLGDDYRLEVPALGPAPMTLQEIAHALSERLVNLFRRNDEGLRAAYPTHSPLQRDPAWRDLLLFPEYFHAETGEGLGAMHQTGWTGLVANLVQRKYREDVPPFWQHRPATPHA